MMFLLVPAAVLERTAKKIGTKDDGPQLREKL